MAMQNINSVLLGLVQMMNNFTTIDANKDGVISQDEVNIWAASVIPNASQEELPLYDIFTSQKTDGSKNELGAANFKALANGDDTVNNDDIARMQKFLTPSDKISLEQLLESLLKARDKANEGTNKAQESPFSLEQLLESVLKAIDKLVEQGQLTQEKANELKAQAAEDPTKVWISLVVGIGGNLTTSEKTIEDRIKQDNELDRELGNETSKITIEDRIEQDNELDRELGNETSKITIEDRIELACIEANKQAPGLNLNPQDWINNLSSETSLESILSTIKTNAMMYNYMNNPDSTSADNPDSTSADNPDSTSADNPDSTSAETPEQTTEEKLNLNS